MISGVQNKRSVPARAVLVACWLSAALLPCGCETDHGWHLSDYPATDIVPLQGDYSFDQEGRFSVSNDPATGESFVVFSRDGARFDRSAVIKGVFLHTHGEIDGADCPPDSYGISGSFVTDSRAIGEIAYAEECRITRRAGFNAQRLGTTAPQ